MKQLVIIITILLTAFFANAQDALSKLDSAKLQNPHIYTAVIKTNPLTILWGEIPMTSEYRLCFETVTARNQSAQIDISYLGTNLIIKSLEEQLLKRSDIQIVAQGYRLQARYKFFVLDHISSFFDNNYSPEGWYIGPHISYATAVISDREFLYYDYYIRGTHLNMNIIMGRQRFRGNFTYDFFFGLGYKNNFWIERENTQVSSTKMDFGQFYNSHIHIVLGINAGFGF